MRRFALYILIGFLGFLTGNLAVYFFQSSVAISSYLDAQNESVGEVKILPAASDNYVCNDSVLNALSEQLKTETFIKKHSGEQVNCFDLYEVRKIDLNNDGEWEIIIFGKDLLTRGSNGNSQLWVFTRIEGSYN